MFLQGRGGFSLVEMLVAFAVGALVLVSLATVVSGSMAVSRKSNNSLAAYNAAAAALDVIGSDLESLAATAQSFEYLQITNEAVAGGTTNARLVFLSLSANDITTNTGDCGQVRAVMYRMANQDVVTSGGSNKIYGLYRFLETNAGATFTNYLGQANLSSVPGFQQAAALDDLLAANIVDFKVRVYPPGSPTPINPNVTDVVRMSGAGVTVGSAAITNGVATAEISVRILDDAGAKLLQNGQALTNVWGKYGHVLSRKVMLRTP